MSHPSLGKIVKKIAQHTPNKRQLWLKGTDPSSTSMQKMGAVSERSIEGVVLYSLAPPAGSKLGKQGLTGR